MTTRYGQGALRRADERIRQLAPGGRNPGTFPHAAGIYELAFGGEIDLEEADRVLVEAATSIGLPRREVVSVLKSAKRKGAQKPRRRPESGQDLATLPPEPPPQYVDPRVIEALSAASVSVLASDKACAYLERRGLDPVRVSRFGRARVLPDDAEIPDELITEFRRAVPQLKFRGQYQHALMLGFRLVFPLVDACGNVRSLQLRCIEEHDGDLPTKGLSLKPSRRKLVLANRAALALLNERTRPELWGEQPFEVVIVEGGTDYLSATTEEIPDGSFRAVFGIFAGSWTATHAALIPDSARIVIATDADAQGDRYAQQIRGTLGGRSFFRWIPNQGGDVCDAGGLSGGTMR